LKYDSVVA